MTDDQVKSRTSDYIRSLGSLDEASKKLGICPGYVSGLLNGKVGAPKWLLMELGIRKVVRFEEIKEA